MIGGLAVIIVTNVATTSVVEDAKTSIRKRIISSGRKAAKSVQKRVVSLPSILKKSRTIIESGLDE